MFFKANLVPRDFRPYTSVQRILRTERAGELANRRTGPAGGGSGGMSGSEEAVKGIGEGDCG